MQIVRTLSVAAMAAIQLLQPSARSEPVLVTTVFDGDTVDVAGIGHVRLLGIDAPEIGHGFDTAAPYGREARDRLAGLVLHRWIRLEYEGPRNDIYGRRLAYLLLEDGTVVNAVLLREGLARISARAPLSRLDELRGAEREAQTFHRGMWRNAPVAGVEETIVSKKGKAPKKAKEPAPKVYKTKNPKNPANPKNPKNPKNPATPLSALSGDRRVWRGAPGSGTRRSRQPRG
jgi:micrococcal nuclease